MSNTNDAPQRRQGERYWVESEDSDRRVWEDPWLVIAIVFWIVGVAAATQQWWALAATGLITGTIAGTRTK